MHQAIAQDLQRFTRRESGGKGARERGGGVVGTATGGHRTLDQVGIVGGTADRNDLGGGDGVEGVAEAVAQRPLVADRIGDQGREGVKAVRAQVRREGPGEVCVVDAGITEHGGAVEELQAFAVVECGAEGAAEARSWVVLNSRRNDSTGPSSATGVVEHCGDRRRRARCGDVQIQHEG